MLKPLTTPHALRLLHEHLSLLLRATSTSSVELPEEMGDILINVRGVLQDLDAVVSAEGEGRFDLAQNSREWESVFLSLRGIFAWDCEFFEVSAVDFSWVRASCHYLAVSGATTLFMQPMSMEGWAEQRHRHFLQSVQL